MYKCKKTLFYNNVQGPSLTTHLKRPKLISSTQVRGYNTVLIISRAPELIKLIFAVSDVSLTMGLTRCYKTEGFSHLYLQFLYIFHAISISYTRLRRRKSICILNFDEIPQSTAEIKLLPVSDNG